MQAMMPLLIVALVVWLGVFSFIWSVDRKVSALEREVKEAIGEGKETVSQ